MAALESLSLKPIIYITMIQFWHICYPEIDIWRKIEEFIVKKRRRYNVSVLIKHPQDFKNDGTKCGSINNGCLIKYKRQGRELYIQRKNI